MPKDDQLYFGHMLDAATKAVARAKHATREEYDRNEDLRIVLVHLIQTVGEAARRVSPEGREAHPEIPWHEIVGMRHKIVHDYMEVDEDVVWSVVRDDLPPLITKLRSFTE
jgi:uncharacterized protein with HEPN domain